MCSKLIGRQSTNGLRNARGDRLQAEAEAAYDEALRWVAVADALAGRHT